MRILAALGGLMVVMGPMPSTGVSEARNSLMTSVFDATPDEGMRLRRAKVKDTRRLYQKTYKSPESVARLARKAGIAPERLARLAAISDLSRLWRVTPRVASLMVDAGVTSMGELARRDPEALGQRVAALNAQSKKTMNLPGRAELAGWIKDARRLLPEDWEQRRSSASIH
jgi:predicted flap endonuclease-1-like 5' DNA nuclease